VEPDPEIVRTRTTHGWAFTDLPAEHEIRVKAYLQDGDPRHLEGTKYVKMRAGVLERMTPRERKVKPEKAATVALLDQALADPDADVHVFDSNAKLFLAVDDNDKVTFRLNCHPVEAMAILHGLFHVLEDAEKKARDDLS
jgi:hypothetical protein